jgi:hypothetical protein
MKRSMIVSEISVGEKSYFDKTLTAFSCIMLLSLSLINLVTPLATGYELTIYDAYPWYFWSLILTTFGCGVVLIIRNAFIKKTNWWIAGLFIAIFSNVIVLCLPFFRGYAFFPNGDAMTHTGMIKDIINMAHIGTQNFYPIVHLIGVNFIFITGLNEATVTNILFISWYIFFVFNIYLLARVICVNNKQALLITAFACPLIFSNMQVLIHPSMLSLVAIPLLLYFYHRSERNLSGKIGSIISSVIIAFFITFTHPVTTIFAAIVLFALIGVKIIFRHSLKKNNNQSYKKATTNFNLPLIVLCAFVFWYFSYAYIQGSIKSVFDFLIQGSRASLFEQQTGALALAGITFRQTLELIVYRYGGVIIYCGISLVITAIYFINIYRKKTVVSYYPLAYYVLFIIGLAASGFSLFGFTGEYSPIRIVRFSLLFVPVIIGLFFYNIFSYSKMHHSQMRKNIILSIIAILITVTSIISTFNIYGSPNTVTANWQVSRAEIEGTKWFSINQNRNAVVADMTGDLSRCEDFNFGIQTRSFGSASLYTPIVPSQFGYETNSSLADTLNNKVNYVLTNEASRISILLVPQNVRFKAHDYGGHGYNNLAKDPSVGLVYASAGFEVWLTGIF